MALKQLTRSTSTMVSILAFVAILIAVNFFAFRHYTRKDLTASKMFTISNATKSILGKMNDEVNIIFYSSANLPGNMVPDYRFTKEYLEELAQLARGKINLRFETPKDDKETEEQLAGKGIQKFQVNVYEKDQLNVMAIYFHVVIQHLDKNRVLGYPPRNSMEYQIASALMEVTQREKPVIAFVTNDKELRFSGLFGFLRDRMRMGERYDMRMIEASDEQPLRIPKECRTLVLVKPKNFSENDLYAIDQFVMRGGNLVAFVQAVDFNNPMAMFQPQPPPNILPLLEKYGVKVNTDLVSDYQSSWERAMPGRMGMLHVMVEVPYPQWVRPIQDGLDRDNPALAQLQTVFMPYPHSLEFAEKLPEGVKTETLIKTTDKAKRQERPPFDLEPPKSMNAPIPEGTDTYTLAAAVSGPIESYYKDKPKPSDDQSDEEKDKDPMAAFPESEDADASKLDQAKEARVVVVSGAQMLDPDFLQSLQRNDMVQVTLVFLENTVDWLSLGSELISIRTKPVADYLLRAKLEDGEIVKAKFVGRFAVPILIALFGVGYWWFRRARMKRLAQVYAS